MEFERPLRGEPMGLDLLNTVWMSKGAPKDQLESLDGVQAWLDELAIAQPATEQTRRALVTAREAIRAHVDDPASESARRTLNEVLAWGHHQPTLTPDGPGTTDEIHDPAQRPGWLAAVSYLQLLAKDASRVRRCAHPDCVLHFYDTSPKRGRRWCSMAACGNRAKAARHYARASGRPPRATVPADHSVR
ncbi:CGNR zinc finger domain-containing protein [Pseudonocardia spinosispora]|uniref:CGNR zinc finger domain-containing protein n=1 Tax=Pseudonocardia spinosispora TaxID=103441 RepID=UPI000688148C|nr:CGNR zinc finger domain-containing protein [Pseudonocardia spinosispora]